MRKILLAIYDIIYGTLSVIMTTTVFKIAFGLHEQTGKIIEYIAFTVFFMFLFIEIVTLPRFHRVVCVLMIVLAITLSTN